ncbi:MAG: hypothetical protein ABL962_15405 [Fimbriimonadaceae bacterium]
MKKSYLVAAFAAVGGAVAFQGSVNLQPTTPGTPQTGNLNITGTVRAGAVTASGTVTGGAVVANTSTTFGGDFRTSNVAGRGILGNASSLTGATYGGLFQNASNAGRGIAGIASRTTGNTYGGFFTSASDAGTGVYGAANATSGTTYGVYGKAVSSGGFGVYSEGPMRVTGAAYLNNAYTSGSMSVGAYLSANSIQSMDNIRAEGNITAVGNIESLADINAGATVRGAHGIFGPNPQGTSLHATANGGADAGNFSADQGTAIYAQSSGRGIYVNAGGEFGIYTEGFGDYALYGRGRKSGGRGIAGAADYANGTGVIGNYPGGNQGWGVYAYGNMGCSGVKPFNIDHPFDPTNKYLRHYSSEAPEPQNFYNGLVTTDGQGKAWVDLPDYFGEINKEPRYTLTVVDDTEGPGFVQVKVARKIRNNRFLIMTSAPSIEVSWEVKAIRNDLYVRKYGAPVEIEKPELYKGKYQNPAIYNQPPEMGEMYQPDPTHPARSAKKPAPSKSRK